MLLYRVLGSDDLVTVSIGIRCGWLSGSVARVGDDVVDVNRAGALLLAALVDSAVASEASSTPGKQMLAIGTGHAVVATAIASRDALAAELEQVVSMLFHPVVDATTFAAAKERLITELSDSFDNPLFKAALHLTEFTEQGKRFSVSRLIEDVESLDLGAFRDYLENVANVSDVVLTVIGDVEASEVEAAIPPALLERGEARATWGGVAPNELGHSDVSKVIPGSADVAVYAVRFDPVGTDGVTALDRYVLLRMLAASVDEADMVVRVDEFDASIVSQSEPALASVINQISELTEAWVEQARGALLESVAKDLQASPMNFSALWTSNTLVGIELLTFLQAVQEYNIDIAQRTMDRLRVSVGRVEVKADDEAAELAAETTPLHRK